MIFNQDKLFICDASNYSLDLFTSKKENLKMEDFSSQIIKKEEGTEERNAPSYSALPFKYPDTEQYERQVDELMQNLKLYIENFVEVEDFELHSETLNEKETQLIIQTKNEFRNQATLIIESLAKDIRVKAIQHILPENYFKAFTEKTKKRIFNSFKSLKKNLLIALENTSNDSNPKRTSGHVKIKAAKRTSFSKYARNLLKSWFFAHAQDPYPSHEEKIFLAKEGGLSMKQLENWLTNTRGRIWRKPENYSNFDFEIQKVLLNNGENLTFSFQGVGKAGN